MTLRPPISTSRSPKSICSWRPGAGLEADSGARLREKLLAIGRERALHGPQARGDALLGGELLAHDIGIAAMPAEALAQPVLQAVQPLPSLRLVERLPAAGVEVPLHRAPVHAQLARDPLRAPAQRSIAATASGSTISSLRGSSVREGARPSRRNSVIIGNPLLPPHVPRRGQVFVSSGAHCLAEIVTEQADR